MSEKQELTFEQKVARSSQVLMVEYHPGTKTLDVIFKGTQFVYTYLGCEPDVWERLQLAHSIGSFIHHNVKKIGLQYEKAAVADDVFNTLVCKNADIVKALDASHQDEKSRIAQAH